MRGETRWLAERPLIASMAYHPSSDLAALSHLLPQGEKGTGRVPAFDFPP
jgi:hypothetical protein